MSTGGSWGKESHDVGLDPTSDRTPTVLESGAYNPIVFTVVTSTYTRMSMSVLSMWVQYLYCVTKNANRTSFHQPRQNQSVI
jgi:hypothetical protein